MPTAQDIVDQSDDVVFQGEAELDASFDEIESQLEEGIDDINQVSSDSLLPFSSMIEGFLPQPVECQTYSLDFPNPIGSLSFDCARFAMFKDIYGWFLSVITMIYIWHMAVQPVNR